MLHCKQHFVNAILLCVLLNVLSLLALKQATLLLVYLWGKMQKKSNKHLNSFIFLKILLNIYLQGLKPE